MKKKLITVLIPILLYPICDFLGQLIIKDINFGRIIALTLAASIFYQWEIPMFFKAIENFNLPKKYTSKFSSLFFNEENKFNSTGKTTAATIYFNPLWIARHMLFIELGVISWNLINWQELLRNSIYQGSMSFLTTMPIVLVGNYLVQNKLPLEKRFLGNSFLSGTLVIAYALGHKFF